MELFSILFSWKGKKISICYSIVILAGYRQSSIIYSEISYISVSYIIFSIFFICSNFSPCSHRRKRDMWYDMICYSIAQLWDLTCAEMTNDIIFLSIVVFFSIKYPSMYDRVVRGATRAHIFPLLAIFLVFYSFPTPFSCFFFFNPQYRWSFNTAFLAQMKPFCLFDLLANTFESKFFDGQQNLLRFVHVRNNNLPVAEYRI